MSLPNELLPVGLLGTGAAAEGYAIERSVRFNSADSTYLSRTPASAGNRKTWTWAGWVKRSAAGLGIVFYRLPSAGNGSGIAFTGNDTLVLSEYISSATVYTINSSSVFRDFSAWYHIVAVLDTTNATNTERLQLYVNGERLTSFGTATYPSQDYEGLINQAELHTIGRQEYSPNYAHFNGYLADVHFIDGQALDPTSFGEFDDNGIWQPIAYTGNYGFASVADATGALPIYNTTDTLGAVKGTGTRTDSNSSSIVLAIPMDGANNGTTFTDESATIKGSGIAKTVTAYGNTKTITSESKFYGSSADFVSDGTDYLVVSHSSDLNLNSATNFTIEAWVYVDTNRTYNYFVSKGNGTTREWALATTATTVIFYWSTNGGSSGDSLISISHTVATARWNHIAAVKLGSTITLYVNGISIGSGSFTSGYIGTSPLYVGRFADYTGISHSLDGKINDLRIYNGVAKYTSNFTPVTTNNSFHLPFDDNSTAAALGTDTSGAGNDWTVNNLIAGPTTTSNSWSGYFDGNGDSLTTGASANLALGSGDFTVEAFIFRTGAGGAIASSRVLSNQNLLYWNFVSDSAGELRFQSRTAGGTQYYARSATSAITANKWYHVAAVRQSNVITVYVNGVAGPTTVNDGGNNLTEQYVAIGLFNFTGFASYFSGYISNLRIIKGTALYTSNFTPPNEPLTAITNTSILTLQDSTFIDNSTNSFTLTANGNAKVSTDSPFEESVDTDSFVDVPTNGTEEDTGLGGQVRGNYCTINPLDQRFTDNGTISNGNLNYAQSSTGSRTARCTIGISSGKWYWEFTHLGGNASHGIAKSSCSLASYPGGIDADGWSWFAGGNIYNNGGATATYSGLTYTTNDVIGVALDLDVGTLVFYKNGVSQGTAASGLTGTWFPAFGSSNVAVVSFTANFGQRPFAYTAPSGFKALNTASLPAPVITKPSEYMDVKLYTGNGSTQTISGLEFSPDLVWLKKRGGDATLRSHHLFDVVRGTNKVIYSNLTNAEFTDTDALTSFNSDGFSLGAEVGINTLNDSLVAWAWDAGSSTVTNTDGSITSNCRTNASAGFSIVSWVSTGASETIGHGLGVAPKIYITKNRSSVKEWPVYTTAIDGSFDYLFLNLTDAKGDSGLSAPTSTVFTVNNLDSSGSNMIAYCFAPVDGYSSMGSYSGSSSDVFVYTGFRPKFILVKCTNTTSNWTMIDTSRTTYNSGGTQWLYPNLSNAEGTTSVSAPDILSNGFKFFGTTSGVNENGNTYIYYAVAESPFQYARAR